MSIVLQIIIIFLTYESVITSQIYWRLKNHFGIRVSRLYDWEKPFKVKPHSR